MIIVIIQKFCSSVVTCTAGGDGLSIREGPQDLLLNLPRFLMYLPASHLRNLHMTCMRSCLACRISSWASWSAHSPLCLEQNKPINQTEVLLKPIEVVTIEFNWLKTSRGYFHWGWSIKRIKKNNIQLSSHLSLLKKLFSEIAFAQNEHASAKSFVSSLKVTIIRSSMGYLSIISQKALWTDYVCKFLRIQVLGTGS